MDRREHSSPTPAPPPGGRPPPPDGGRLLQAPLTLVEHHGLMSLLGSNAQPSYTWHAMAGPRALLTWSLNSQRKGKMQCLPFLGPESTTHGPKITSSGMVFVLAIVLVVTVVEVVVEGLNFLQVTLQSKPRPWALPSVAHCTERRPRYNNGFFGLLDRQYLDCM